MLTATRLRNALLAHAELCRAGIVVEFQAGLPERLSRPLGRMVTFVARHAFESGVYELSFRLAGLEAVTASGLVSDFRGEVGDRCSVITEALPMWALVAAGVVVLMTALVV